MAPRDRDVCAAAHAAPSPPSSVFTETRTRRGSGCEAWGGVLPAFHFSLYLEPDRTAATRPAPGRCGQEACDGAPSRERQGLQRPCSQRRPRALPRRGCSQVAWEHGSQRRPSCRAGHLAGLTPATGLGSQEGLAVTVRHRLPPSCRAGGARAWLGPHSQSCPGGFCCHMPGAQRCQGHLGWGAGNDHPC